MAATTDATQPSINLAQAIGSGLVRFGRAIQTEFAYALRTTSGRIGLPIVILHLTLALVGPWLAPYSATEFHYDDAGQIHQLLSPSSQFWLGTDQFGRDILSRIMSGARSLIVVSVAGAGLGILLGTLVGMSSGYKGGRTDEITMRIMDGMMSFPSLLLALLVLTTLGTMKPPMEWMNSIWQETLIVGTTGVVFMPRVARVLRSATLVLKEMEFVQSARLRGEPTFYIIFREILPNAVSVLGVEASIRLSYAILLVSSLGFLGMGIQPPSPGWGLMISESRRFMVLAPWVAIAPAVAVASLVIGVNLLADGIRQARGLPLEDMNA